MNRNVLPILFAVLMLAKTLAAAGNSQDSQALTQNSSFFSSLRINSFSDGFSESSDQDSINPAPIFTAKMRQTSQQSREPGDFGASVEPSDPNQPVVLQQIEQCDCSDVKRTNCCTAPDAATYGSSTWRPLDTLSLFGGLEGSKQPQDFGVNANFGSRWAANWGFPLLAEYGIGVQMGTSINYTDNAVQVFDRVGATSTRTQSYSTVGVFQRFGRWRWGLGYDFLYENYYDQFFLGQWRGRAGYAVTDTDEFGIWSSISQRHDSGMFLNIPVTLTPLTQGSIYWQHLFSTGTRTMFWIGVSEGHAQANLALGDLKKTGDQFVFGAEIDVPLNRYVALYGQANFISPADSGTVDSYLGLSFYPGGHAFPAMRNPFTPLLALANSTMFATDITRH
jgi:hypothetical protein